MATLELVAGSILSHDGVATTADDDTSFELTDAGLGMGALERGSNWSGPWIQVAKYPVDRVGRHHTFIVRRGSSWVAEHSGTTNPTIVNGQIVYGEIELEDGDVIEFSNGTKLRFSAP
ncbi:MAG: FHA domain-containing protein [Deltaproteobacteria bacterium]